MDGNSNLLFHYLNSENVHLKIFITECVQVVASEGTYVVRPKFGSMRACGIYIAGLHNESIRVDISRVDVTCKSRGLVAVSDLFCSKHVIFV